MIERLCIYPKDVQIVTGRSQRYGRKVISQIKKKLSKENHQLVTVDELCNHLGLEKTEVLKHIRA